MSKMKIKTTLKFHLTPVRLATMKTNSNKYWQGCNKKEPSVTVGGNAKQCDHYGNQNGGSLKN
jgi:hypothetical protein